MDIRYSAYIIKNYKVCPFKHTTTLFSLSDHDFLSREWRVIVDQVYIPIMMVDLWYYNQSGATEQLIMSAFHYCQMCFKSVKTLGALHS